MSFGEVNDPPQYCYEWKVRYQTYGAWIDGSGCKDMSDNAFTIIWETLYAHSGSAYSDPGDTGYFKVRARSSCSSDYGYWSNWKEHNFTVPDSD